MLSGLILISASLILLTVAFVFSIRTDNSKDAETVVIAENCPNFFECERFLISEFSTLLLDGLGYRDSIVKVLDTRDSVDNVFIGVANLRIQDGSVFAFMDNKIIGKLSEGDASNFLLDVGAKNLVGSSFLSPVLIVRKLNSILSDRDSYEARLIPRNLAKV